MAKQLRNWAAQPFRFVIDHLREAARFEGAVSFGLANAGRVALAEQLFQELEQLTTPDSQITPESAKRLADFRKRDAEARALIEQGLPLLHSQLSLGLWSILEASMDDFVVAWLCNIPSTLQTDDFSRIKISVAEFERLDRTAQIQHVISEFKRNARTEEKLGVERFEMLLKPLGLAGPVDDDVRRDIYELSQIRNAILHRGSRADAKLVAACPWLNLKAGDQLLLTRDYSIRYAKSVTAYLKGIIQRAWTREEAVEEVIE